MGYLHIPNLYKDKKILRFKHCFALEKIHGTSAHVSFKEGKIVLFSGGENHERFEKLFDKEALLKKYNSKFIDTVTLFGEAYGGKQQGMSATYGKELKFVVFDVKVGNSWLSVPDAEDVALYFDLEFVFYEKVKAEIRPINRQRNARSIQAMRNGIKEKKPREGVVLRPLIEMTKNNGSRVICKHKTDEFRETKTPRIVSDKELKILTDATNIANEWVTLERLKHVLDKVEKPIDEKKTGLVIKAMIEDVYREGKGEIIESKAVQKAIGKKTSTLFFKYLRRGVM